MPGAPFRRCGQSPYLLLGSTPPVVPDNPPIGQRRILTIDEAYRRESSQRRKPLCVASYSTNFSLTENPISEMGAWIGPDPAQAAVQTTGGLALGTQTGDEAAASNFNDSHAFLSWEFPPDQWASAVVHNTHATPSSLNGNLEVELLLRMSIGPSHSAQWGATIEYGYEINMGQGGSGSGLGYYIQIGRWKDSNLFDSLVSGSPLTGLGIHEGDVFYAQIVGGVITVKLNSTVIASVTDPSPYAHGAPGVGFFRHNIGTPDDPSSYCFTSYSAGQL